MQENITIAITGASGSIYGLRLLEVLAEMNMKINLICSETAIKVSKLELGFNIASEEFIGKHFGNNSHKIRILNSNNLAECISSGSFMTKGMIIIPCSMGALGRIAAGTSDNLIARAADVCLKERKKLVLVARETPLNTIHLQNMLTVSQCGGIILPATPAFYHKPSSIDDLINFIVGKTLDICDIPNNLFKRWGNN